MNFKTLKNIFIVTLALIGSMFLAIPVKASPTTPSNIYTVIDTGSAEVTLKKALYPITDTSTRTWYINDIPVPIDGINFIDKSNKQDAVLKLSNLTTAFHSSDIKVVDTSPVKPSGTIDDDQFVRLYVIQKDFVETASLELKKVENRVAGDTLNASSLSLFMNGTAFPNFQSLAFIIDGNLSDTVTVPSTNTAFTVIETMTGKTVSLNIEGKKDENPPTITKLLIKDSLENKFALMKEIEVEAEDDEGELPVNPFYMERDYSFSSYLKEEISKGKKSADLKGIAWEDTNTFEVYSNGKYTVFVRDSAGNISYRDIEVKKISSSVPVIYYVDLCKEGEDVFLEVNAYDDDGQPLMYKLNKGKWQTSNRLYGVAEGVNSIYVRNEAGAESKTTKEVFLKLFTNKVSELTPESLKNYIVSSPSTWTNKTVTLSLKLPDSIKKYLDTTPYSINGEKFSTNNNYNSSVQDEIVQFAVKDVYGNIHSSENYIVKNIDRDNPSIKATEEKGTITISGQDALSGVYQIYVSGRGLNHYILKTNGVGISYDSVVYTATSNGSYQFTVVDMAGNIANATVTIDSFKKDTVQSNYSKSNTTTTVKANAGTKTNSSSGSRTSKDSNNNSDIEISEDTEIIAETSDSSSSSTVSNAGHSKPGERKDAKKIVVDNKKGLTASTSEVVKLESVQMKEDNRNNLRKLLWIAAAVILGSVVVAVVINIKK